MIHRHTLRKFLCWFLLTLSIVPPVESQGARTTRTNKKTVLTSTSKKATATPASKKAATTGRAARINAAKQAALARTSKKAAPTSTSSKAALTSAARRKAALTSASKKAVPTKVAPASTRKKVVPASASSRTVPTKAVPTRAVPIRATPTSASQRVAPASAVPPKATSTSTVPTGTSLTQLEAATNSSVAQELGALQKAFGTPKGFDSLKNTPITLDYQHIFGMNFDSKDPKAVTLSGFHHDSNNKVEKAGTINFATKGKNKHGYYSATLLYQGKPLGTKNFFPANWSRTKVVGKIREAYNDAVKNSSKIQKRSDGSFEMLGTTQEGVTIKMLMNKRGVIFTAYPARI